MMEDNKIRVSKGKKTKDDRLFYYYVSKGKWLKDDQILELFNGRHHMYHLFSCNFH